MKIRLTSQNLPLLATIAICILLYVVVGVRHPAFFSLRVISNLLRGNAVLGIAAIGVTFVILSGGIDLSVGAVVGCASIVIAALIEKKLSPALVLPGILFAGIAFGVVMGCLIQLFGLPPFLVTLAGLFLCRGLALVISERSIGIPQSIMRSMRNFAIPFGSATTLSGFAMIFIVLLIIAICVARLTRFGRNVYAIGGSETSAILMGLPVARTKVFIYALSAFCAALAGCVFAMDTGGNAVAGAGLELDAIAAVVVGGTLLSGGVAGTFVGVLIFGIIQEAIKFEGTLNAWWTKIAVGGLLLVFVVLQRLLTGARFTPSPFGRGTG